MRRPADTYCAPVLAKRNHSVHARRAATTSPQFSADECARVSHPAAPDAARRAGALRTVGRQLYRGGARVMKAFRWRIRSATSRIPSETSRIQ